MKKSWSLIALAAALAASASAASVTPATPAGTVIENKAEISFTPEPTPGNPTPPETTVPSNPVTTTVLPVPSFTITPNDGNADTTKPDYSKPGQTGAVKPCDKNVSYLYTLTNTGNVAGETYTLTNTPDPTGAVKAPENIRYYPASADTNTDGKLSAEEVAASAPITTLGPVAQDATVKFFQVYDIPCGATDKDVYGGDPTGTRNNQSDPKLNPSTPIPVDANNSNTSTVTRNDNVVIGPKADPDGNGNPTTPAYQSPENVTITPSAADTQVAQATTTTTTITFTNTVQNTGNRPDVLNIDTALAGFPADTTVKLFEDTNKNGVFDAGDKALADSNNDGKPDVGTVAPNGTADVFVQVTFPAGQAPAAGVQPTVTVNVISANDPSKKDPTRDIVNLPGVAFGDPTPSVGGNPTPVGTPPVGTTTDFPNGSGNPNNPIVPPATCTTTIRTYLPMEVGNLGSAPDVFDITGTAPIKLKSGATVNTPVVYYRDVNGNGALDSGDTVLADTNGNGTPDTGSIPAGGEVKLVAVVDVPCDAAAQVITLTQNAKSPTTGATGDDKNDTITVGTTGKPTATKSVDLTSAKPGDTLTYTIIGKNDSNANVTAAKVCDTVPANTTFVSFSAASAAGPVLYSNDGGNTWQSAPVTTPGSKLCAAVDSDKDGKSDGTITTADILKPGQSINVTFKVKVN